MRLLIDIMVAVMLASILAGVVMHHGHVRAIHNRRELARSELTRFQQQVNLQAALGQVAGVEHRYPVSVDPEWFQGDLPENPLLGDGHPWVEVAGPNRKSAEHPARLVATERSEACFWYNPHTGVVRARVPAGISDAEALELYNYVNDCCIVTLFPAQ